MDLKVESSYAKIDENLANYFSKKKLSCYKKYFYSKIVLLSS